MDYIMLLLRWWWCWCRWILYTALHTNTAAATRVCVWQTQTWLFYSSSVCDDNLPLNGLICNNGGRRRHPAPPPPPRGHVCVKSQSNGDRSCCPFFWANEVFEARPGLPHPEKSNRTENVEPYIPSSIGMVFDHVSITFGSLYIWNSEMQSEKVTFRFDLCIVY